MWRTLNTCINLWSKTSIRTIQPFMGCQKIPGEKFRYRISQCAQGIYLLPSERATTMTRNGFSWVSMLNQSVGNAYGISYKYFQLGIEDR